MTATILLVALAIGGAQPEKAVTDAEKKAFLELITRLPTAGEFFTEEGVTTAVPYTRGLLALTEKDLGKGDLYAFLALSRGLVDRQESRQYGISHFGKIAHPTIKLAWACMLIGEGPDPPEIIAFLRKALDSKADAQTLAAMTGPGFEEFKERVIRSDERARQVKVVLVKRHTIDAIPGGGPMFHDTRENCTLGPDQRLYACRPLKQHGELIAYDLARGSMNRLAIPQPGGFKATFDFKSDFEDPALAVNSRGDLLCRWTLEGNGDHALALLRKGSTSFVVNRVDLPLADGFVVAEPEGAWYLVQGPPRFTVYRIEGDLKLTRLGEFAGKGHHTIRIMDARFLSKDVLHLFWADVLPTGNHLRMRCIDFDVKERRWSHNRELFRLDRFVSSADGPTVLQLEDASLHYLWKIDEGQNRGEATGLYYQAEAEGRTEKISGGRQFGAIAVGNLIVVCYTLAESPEGVFFRVINQGARGP